MPQLRRDPIVDRWTLVEVKSSKPADQYTQEKHQSQHPDVCPFCPGHEALTTPEVQAVRAVGSEADKSGWTIRTIPN